tara:strand:- start:1434 stop:1847 length:414 start_codon:yes stop_codon:yes gene_type:complete
MTTIAPFPDIKPTTRKFKMGDIPSTTYTSLSGVVFKRAFGNTKTNYTLDLTFKNISDSSDVDSRTTTGILKHYDQANGTFSSFTVPDPVFVGMEDAVLDYIQAPADIKWRYAKPPEVQSVQSNLSTVTVSFIGELQA